MWFPKKLNETIKHLSTSEQEEIREIYIARRKAQLAANRLLATARGSYDWHIVVTANKRQSTTPYG